MCLTYVLGCPKAWIWGTLRNLTHEIIIYPESLNKQNILDTQTLKTILPNLPTSLDSIGMCTYMSLTLGSVCARWVIGNALLDTLASKKSIYFEMEEECLLLFTCFFVNWVLSLWPSPNMSMWYRITKAPGCGAIRASIPIPDMNPISSEQDPWNPLDFLLLSALNEFMIHDVPQTWEKNCGLLIECVWGKMPACPWLLGCGLSASANQAPWNCSIYSK